MTAGGWTCPSRVERTRGAGALHSAWLLNADAGKLDRRDPRSVSVDGAAVRPTCVRPAAERDGCGRPQDLDEVPARSRATEEPPPAGLDLEAELLVEEAALDQARVVLERKARRVRKIGRREDEVRAGSKIEVRELGRRGVVHVRDLARVEAWRAPGREGSIRRGGRLHAAVGELEPARRALDRSCDAQLLARAPRPDADVARGVLDDDLAPVGGGADVPVSRRPEVDVARVRADGRRIELGGVVAIPGPRRGDL